MRQSWTHDCNSQQLRLFRRKYRWHAVNSHNTMIQIRNNKLSAIFQKVDAAGSDMRIWFLRHIWEWFGLWHNHKTSVSLWIKHKRSALSILFGQWYTHYLRFCAQYVPPPPPQLRDNPERYWDQDSRRETLCQIGWHGLGAVAAENCSCQTAQDAQRTNAHGSYWWQQLYHPDSRIW